MPDSILTSREIELVTLGAALGSNCLPCIQHHIPEARKAGLTEVEIRAAIDLADHVRQVPARKVLEAAHAALESEKNGGHPPTKEAGACNGLAPPAAKSCC